MRRLVAMLLLTHPLRSGNARLTKESHKQVLAYFPLMGIRYSKRDRTLDHVWMFPLLIRAIEAEFSHASDKNSQRNRPQLRHTSSGVLA